MFPSLIVNDLITKTPLGKKKPTNQHQKTAAKNQSSSEGQTEGILISLFCYDPSLTSSDIFWRLHHSVK